MKVPEESPGCSRGTSLLRERAPGAVDRPCAVSRTFDYDCPAKYPPELRERAVRMYRTTEPKPLLKRMAAELGVRPEALRGWIGQAEADTGRREDRLTTDGLLLGFAPQSSCPSSAVSRARAARNPCGPLAPVSPSGAAIGLLELHQENFALPDESGMELLVLSAAPGSPAEDGLRLLAGLGADSGDAHPTVNAQVRE